MAGLDFSHRAETPQQAHRAEPANFAARATAKPASTAEDVYRSVMQNGLPAGAAQFAGQFGDLRDLAKTGATAGAQWVAEHLGLPPPKAGASSLQFPISPQAALMNVVADRIGQVTHTDPTLGKAAMSWIVPGAQLSGPNSSQVLHAALGGKAPYTPQTTAGEYARTIAQYAPAAALPTGGKTIIGDGMRRLANVVVPGVASETAGQLTKGQPYEGAARVAGGIGGGALTTFLTAPRPSTQMLARATKGATDEQIGQARQLMTDAQNHGVPITAAEAIQQVTGGATGMGRLQRVLEGSKEGEAAFGPMMAARPDQVRQAVTNFADTVAPATGSPAALGLRTQEAAQGGLDNLRQMINGLAEPHYKAAAGTLIDPAQFEALQSNPAYAHAAQELSTDPILGARVQGAPPNDLATVNSVVQQLDRNKQAFAQTAMNPGGNNLKASDVSQARQLADQLAAATSPEWREARDIGAMGRRSLLEPLQAGPVGSMATTSDLASQIRSLYPTAPPEGANLDTTRAVQALSGADPTVPPALARQHLVNTANEAMQNLTGGPSQWGGAKYAAVIAGNPEQRANLLAGVSASGGDKDQLSRLIDVLEATGKRQAQGSKTAFNASDLRTLGEMGPTQQVVDAILNPPGVLHRAGDAYQRWVMGQNVDRLVKALTSQPDQATQAIIDARTAAPPDLADKAIPSLEYLLLSRRQPSQIPGGP